MFISHAYLQSISEDKRRQIMHSRVRLGYHPETNDMLTIADVDRYAGTYVLGVQGVGKSGLLENLIAHDAQAGNAVIVIDPHGDLVAHCIAQLPQACVPNMFLLDMEDEAYPFGVNVFATGKLDSSIAQARAVDRLMHIFEVLWPDVLSQQHLPRYVRAATLTLLANPGSTLVDMYTFLLDGSFREQLLRRVADPSVRQFWQLQYDDLSEAERSRRVQPLIGRLEALFMGRSLVRNIVGQRQTTINFRQAIEERKIIFIRLPIKTVAQDARLVGTIIMAQIHAAVFSFADVPERERPGLSLYVDEFQHFSTPDFAELFTEGRKFGVKVTVAHQYRGQLPPYLQASTMTARTKVCFQMTPEDAREMAHIFPPQEEAVSPENIVPKPAEYLLTYGSDEPAVKRFVDDYLRPMQVFKRGSKVEMGQHLTFDFWHGTDIRDVVVADPTPYLDNLLYQVMRTGNPDITIPYEVVMGFARCGRGFYGHARTASSDVLGPDVRFPHALVIPSGDSYRWTRPPESGLEQMYHFIFYLRMVMQYLSQEPIGKKSAPSTTVVSQMLTQLPRRAAFVRSGETVGVIYTYDTPGHLKTPALRDRVQEILACTRATYCHPRDQVEHLFLPIEAANVIQDGPAVDVPPQGSRWEVRDE